MADRPDPMALWQQAGGGTKDYDPGRYRELLHEAGMILRPGDAGYKDAPRNLPCGWPHRYDPASPVPQICPSCQTGDHCTGGISFCECECTTGEVPGAV